MLLQGRPLCLWILMLKQQESEEEAEEEQVPKSPPPPNKKTKLMADAMPKVPAKTKPAPKGKGKAENTIVKKKKALIAQEEEEEEVPTHHKKLRPYLPMHNDEHPEAEDMKKRRDRGLRAWRAHDPYVARSRNEAVDPRFHNIEQQDFL